ncbi:hypothetical protein BU24DRAFT_336040, partial [Aaosphaeria arxii CBS 175.79]
SKSPPLPQATRSPREHLLHHFDDPPSAQADDSPPPEESQPTQHDDPLDPPYHEDDGEIPYPEPDSHQMLLPPQNFNPFFTLIEDTTTGEHYHPYVHYVFADDDPVIMTAAAMRSLGLDDTKYLPETSPESGEHEEQEEQRRRRQQQSEQDPSQAGDDEDDDERDRVHDSPHVESPLPPPIPGVKERYIVVDVGADGHEILDAQSLSSEWQITSANVRTAPSFDEEAPDQGYMLRIEGVEIGGKGKGKAKGEPGEGKLKDARDASQGDIFAALEGLIKGVEIGLDVAGKIRG